MTKDLTQGNVTKVMLMCFLRAAAVINILLDTLFVVAIKQGIGGAAFAAAENRRKCGRTCGKP